MDERANLLSVVSVQALGEQRFAALAQVPGCREQFLRRFGTFVLGFFTSVGFGSIRLD